MIPKRDKNRNFLKSWRPISLLNVDFKILAKLMASRMKLILNDIIDPVQTGFVHGRNISDNIRKFFDIMELTEIYQIPAMIVQVDLEKAFDRVDYEALFSIMKFFKFGNNFISWVKLLFADFQLATMNNGHLSEFFSPTRGLFQGNPIAPYLFLLLGQILVIKLQNNPKIEGIEAKNIKMLLSLFADDLDLFLKYKESVWNAVMKEFDNFEHITGMKISYEKTTIYRIGSLKGSNAKFYSSRKIQWTNEPVNVLGVIACHDLNECFKLNLDPIVEKTRNVLNNWKPRGLSLIGKVEVVNTLIASLFVYKSLVLPCIPKTYIKQIESIIQEFIWDGGKSKIAMDKLKGLKTDGGLGLVDIEARDRAFKASWVFRIKDNEFISKLAFVLMENPLGHDLWRANLNTKDIKKLFPKVNKFWQYVMSVWFNVSCIKPKDRNMVGNQLVWYNSEIRIDNKPIFHKKLYQAGLKTISDILDRTNNFLNFEEFSRKFGIKDYCIYAGIIASIPDKWKQLLNVDEENYEDNLYMKLQNTPKVTGVIYKRMKNDEKLIQSKVIKIENILETEVDYETVLRSLRNINKITISVKLRSFQYRFLMGGIITNRLLKIYKVRENDWCTFCGSSPETMIHLFWECIKVRPVWTYIQKLISTKVTFKEIFLVNVEQNPNRVENVIVLIAKQFIYKHRCLQNNLVTDRLNICIKNYETIEYEIAKKKNNIGTHEIKWKDLKQKLL